MCDFFFNFEFCLTLKFRKKISVTYLICFRFFLKRIIIRFFLLNQTFLRETVMVLVKINEKYD